MGTTNTPGQLQAEMDIFAEWCRRNCLDLNPSRTKEVVVDFRKNPTIIPTLSLNNQLVERVESYRYLGTIIDHRLTFQSNSEIIFSKCQQRLFFLRKLCRLQVHQSVLTAFYKCFIESVITFNISAWFGSLSSIHRNPLNKIITMSSKIIGLEQESLINIYNRRVKSKDRELLFIREYCTVLKPLTEALDILQGEENCYYGTLLPTLESLMSRTLGMKNGLQILGGLPDAIVQSIKTRFESVLLSSEDAVLAAVTLPKFKLRWLRHDQERKDQAEARLLAECRKQVFEQEQQERTESASTEDVFFSFSEDEKDIYSLAENEVADYLKSGESGIDSLNKFPLIKKISRRYNAATPSSAPVERLFSLGSLILSPKTNRLSDEKFERILLLRYSHWFKD
ncbi:uncharacterized protein V6R79_004430 [Siganus canaliculatus]